MKTTFQFPLLDLPNELIAEPDVQETPTAGRAEPVLYRYALIRDGLELKPARAKAIHELDIPCDCGAAPRFDGLASLLESAVNLKRLMLEMPQVNNGEFEDQELHEQMTTALLRPFQAALSEGILQLCPTAGDGDQKADSPVDPGLNADYHVLEHVTLHGRCFNFERAVMSSRSPPILKSLTYQVDEIFWPLRIDLSPDPILLTIPFIRAPSSSVPKSLTTLRIISQPQNLTTMMTSQVDATARNLKRMGINLECLYEPLSTYYPPYLYGEPVPTAVTVYDGGWKEISPDQKMGMWARVED
ncbi:hypothetical protein BST61_g10985 [Cercospora zeina]